MGWASMCGATSTRRHRSGLLLERRQPPVDEPGIGLAEIDGRQRVEHRGNETLAEQETDAHRQQHDQDQTRHARAASVQGRRRMGPLHAPTHRGRRMTGQALGRGREDACTRESERRHCESPTRPRPDASSGGSREDVASIRDSQGRPNVDTYDYVIVGAGSAGSVLANRLSEDGTASVLVLEAGPSDWHPYIHMPAGFIKTFHIPSVNWLYHMEPSHGPAGGASSPRAARRWAAPARSTATSTTAASAWTSTPGRSSATAAGAMPTCSLISGAWSAAWATATRPSAAATAR